MPLLFILEENFGGFGETSVIRQNFTQPNSRFTKVSNVSYCKLTNIFLAKTLKRSICPSFTPPTFCAIRYIICFCVMCFVNNTHLVFTSKLTVFTYVEPL